MAYRSSWAATCDLEKPCGHLSGKRVWLADATLTADKLRLVDRIGPQLNHEQSSELSAALHGIRPVIVAPAQRGWRCCLDASWECDSALATAATAGHQLLWSLGEI